MPRTVVLFLAGTLVLVVAGPRTNLAFAQLVVPGTGTLIDYVGDDFEDPEWEFVPNGTKSSREQDGQVRAPLGYSTNRRWDEGPERGYPDLLKVIETPPGGLPGSEYSLLMRTQQSGVPGRVTNDVQQDDLIVDCITRLGTTIPVSELPNCVARVFLPPPEHWENRSGPHFGFRASLSTTRQKSSRGGFMGSHSESTAEPYWPGMWVHFRSETDRGVESDSAFIKVRGDQNGRDFKVLEIQEYGWWTLGMSFTPDGMVHFFASPGVDRLTAADHITSQYPYSFRAERFRTFFFNVCNRYDGRTWSTPFVVDEAQLYVVNASRVTALVEKKQQQKQRSEQPTATARGTKKSTSKR